MIKIKPKELQTLLIKSQDKLYDFLLYKILPYYYDNDAIHGNGMFIYVEGEIPVMVLAHLDTVFIRPPFLDECFYDPRADVMWSPEGLGADDRAGVYAILALLSLGYRPHILFLKDEEIGGIGAQIAAVSFLDVPDIRYMIEFDRQGSTDAVFYDDTNQEFIEYICSFGFKKSYGTFSDITFICPEWKISGVNLSVGYYRAHTKQEFLRLRELAGTITRVALMLDNLPEQTFEYKELKKPYQRYTGKGHYVQLAGGPADNEAYDMDEEEYSWAFGMEPYENDYCSACNAELYDSSGFKIGAYGKYCIECFNDYVEYCSMCNQPYDKRYEKYSRTQQKICLQCGTELEASMK